MGKDGMSTGSCAVPASISSFPSGTAIVTAELAEPSGGEGA